MEDIKSGKKIDDKNSKLQKQPAMGVLIKWCSVNYSKFTREHPHRSVISIKLQSNFTEITFGTGVLL